MAKKLFVTGTGTDVGKTYVTGLMLKKLNECGLSAGYYKAAMSGNVRREDGSLIPGDALFVKETSGIAQPLEEMCPYVYEHAYSPHLASRVEGNPVSLDVVREGFLRVCEQYDYVTMEGSGGILCPICFDEQELWLEDVIRELDLACLIVADAGLGTINSIVLTVEYMRSRGIPVVGVIMNHYHPGDVIEEDNIRMVEHRTGVRVVAVVSDDSSELFISGEALKALYRE